MYAVEPTFCLDNPQIWETEYQDQIGTADCWQVIDAFFQEKGLVRQQLDSFDEFINSMIQHIIVDTPPVDLQAESQHLSADSEKPPRYTVTFDSKVYLGKPTKYEQKTVELYPNEARLRNLTYAAPLCADVSVLITHPRGEPEQRKYPQLQIGRIPIMLKSSACALSSYDEKDIPELGECSYDQGGYFIISGSEKVLIGQESMGRNTVYVFKKTGKYSYVSEIRSVLEGGTTTGSKLYVKLLGKQNVSSKVNQTGQTIRATLPYIKDDIPCIIVFRALGFVSDKDILEHIIYDFRDAEMMEMLKPSLLEAFDFQHQNPALDYIGSRGRAVGIVKAARINHARDILQKEMLPHVGIDEYCETRKAFFFGYIIHRLLLAALGRRECDDRDHFGNKRIDLAGPLLAQLFRQLFRNLVKEIQTTLKRCLDESKDFNITRAIDHNIITRGLRYALATGNWGEQRKAHQTRAGVSQVLNRLTFVSTLSHLRRLKSPIGQDGKLARPRQLHNTHWGMVCPAETPEGSACGLVKNLALMAYITVGTESEPVREFLEDWQTLSFEETSASAIGEATKVFLNGNWVGVHSDPNELVSTLRKVRRRKNISHEVSVVHMVREKELRLSTDAGRVCRPLFVVRPDQT
ncbi:hypothetical protein Zmor_012164 [Zophobas morio]|uniref:DNA-directed RNA polymerase n=1 Tax=Zophobas morio TaxID=2755281 RepID=A0AA38LZG6_9CUCU|nr:hypothetical protein Zmor_012164 [Zophobas morio]